MNFYKYVEKQKLEDRQAFIVHYPAFNGKTRYAKELAKSDPSIYYIDLLDIYLRSPDLTEVADFGLAAFQKWILNLASPHGTQTLILDQGDFIFNTWSKETKGQFINWLRVSLRTPALTDKTLIFFVQTDGIISSSQLTNSQGEPRIMKLSEFDSL
jgi:hypothetical protein